MRKSTLPLALAAVLTLGGIAGPAALLGSASAASECGTQESDYTGRIYRVVDSEQMYQLGTDGIMYTVETSGPHPVGHWSVNETALTVSTNTFGYSSVFRGCDASSTPSFIVFSYGSGHYSQEWVRVS